MHEKTEQVFAHFGSWVEGRGDAGHLATSSRGPHPVTFVDDHALELAEWWRQRPEMPHGFTSPEWCREQRTLIGRRWCELAAHLGVTLEALRTHPHPAVATLQAMLANVREQERRGRQVVAQWKRARRAWQRARPAPPSAREQEAQAQAVRRVGWRARKRARALEAARARVEWAWRVARAWVEGTSVGRATGGVTVRSDVRRARRAARLVTGQS